MANTEEHVGYVNYVDVKKGYLNITFKYKSKRMSVIGKGKFRKSLNKYDTRIIAKIKDFDGSENIIIQSGSTQKNAVIFSVIKNKNFYNGYEAVNLKFYEPNKKIESKVEKKKINVPKNKVTLEEWKKDKRPTIGEIVNEKWWMDADEDFDFLSVCKLPLLPLE